MIENDLKEKNFEAAIEQWLVAEGGYVKGNQDTYDKERAIDLPTLIRFIDQTQHKKWELFCRKHGANAESRLYNDFQDSVSRYGLVYVLRHGIDDLGINLKLCYFLPSSELNIDLMKKYRQNILTETRQFFYSTENRNSIDMVLSLNGIPIVALELKNQLTGQSVEDSREQWLNNRDPQELLFHFDTRILAYFGVDLYEAIMATELKGEKTYFMPYNQGSNGAGNVGGAGNPASEDGDFVTSYLWKRVLQRDMLLAILQRYISRQEEEKITLVRDKKGRIREEKKKSVKLIFPRYHQLDVVERLVADTQRDGSGHNYLIQHSAGSGKSNSIAWLTYQLNALHDEAQKPIFDGVFVITDRRVLNTQLQSTILGFDHKEGQITTVTDKDPSSKLKDAINNGDRIVICTLHRFPIIYKEVTSRAGKHYAVIVDEAHSSQSGKAAEKVKAALADTEEALREMAEIEEKTEEQLEKERDLMLEDLLAQGQHQNLSFYAFTATPKPKTLQTFGKLVKQGDTPEKSIYAPYHIYSMLQAIEEGFIKDVLLQYTPYSVTYEISKKIKDDPEYEEKPATRAVKAFHDNHQHVINQKVEIIVEKFREVTLHAMQGQAKAMVVTASRVHALRYFMQIKHYCEEKGYTDVQPMVAFSGKVEWNGEEYTETKLNSTDGMHISEERLPLYFASDMYNMLVVADKYQTGFDEPLLHTMFVDKKLKNVKAVQTLSRLNRAHPLKEDTYILDFVNAPGDIKTAFEPFYTSTELIRPVDVNGVYNFRNDIAMYNLWSINDEERCYKILSEETEPNKRLGALSNVMKPVVERIEQLEEEEHFKVRSLIKNFIRFYAYMAQVERTYDRVLYKTYRFCEVLYKLIPKTPHEKPDLSQKLKLVNSSIKAKETVSISLEKDKGDVKGENTKAGSKPDEPRDLLSNIIDKVNMMFKGKFTKEDEVIMEAIYDKLSQPKTLKKLQKQAKNNDQRQFAESIFPEIFGSAAEDCYADANDAYARLFQNKELYQAMMTVMGETLYAKFRTDEELQFNPERFKEEVVKMMQTELPDWKRKYRPYAEIAKYLVDIIAAPTMDSMDGANDVLQNAFNRLYCSKRKVALIDKKQHFRSLVMLFEVFLKKLYFLEKGEEMLNTRQGAYDPTKTTFKDAVWHTPCLKALLHPVSDEQKLYGQYLEMVTTWRNDNSHLAPTAKEADFDASIKIITLLYLYVVAQNITDLEIAGFSIGEYPVVLTSVEEDQELRNLIYTRLQYAPDTSDTDLQQEAMTQFGERYPAMKLMDWKRIIEDYTPMIREAAKQPRASVVEMQQRQYGMAAEGEGDFNSEK